MFLIDQTLAQVKGNDPLLGEAELLDRGFDFGHGAHALISTPGAAVRNAGCPRLKNYEAGN